MTISHKQINFFGLCGLSPQVLSESLWSLLQEEKTVVSIHIVSTAKGAEMFYRIFGNQAQRLLALWRGSPVPSLNMELIQDDNGVSVDDIVNDSHHNAAICTIGNRVQSLTQEEALPLYASAAGGRKTMSGILSIAMSIYGRPQDRLNHVLVDPSVEGDPNFLFPEKNSQQRKLVNIVNLPFPRLGVILDQGVRKLPLEQLVEAISKRLSQFDAVIFYVNLRQLVVGGQPVYFRPVRAAIYLYLVRYAQTHKNTDGVNPQRLDVDMMAQCYGEVGASISDVKALRSRLIEENPQHWFLEHLSRLKRDLLVALGPALAHEVGIEKVGRRPSMRYRLRLPLDRLRIEEPGG